MENKDKKSPTGRMSSGQLPPMQNITTSPADKLRTAFEKGTLTSTDYYGNRVSVIDCTPTWEAVLPILLETQRLESSRVELLSMARTADRYNELRKEHVVCMDMAMDSVEILLSVVKDPSLAIGDVKRKIKALEQTIKEYRSQRAAENSSE